MEWRWIAVRVWLAVLAVGTVLMLAATAFDRFQEATLTNTSLVITYGAYNTEVDGYTAATECGGGISAISNSSDVDAICNSVCVGRQTLVVVPVVMSTAGVLLLGT